MIPDQIITFGFCNIQNEKTPYCTLNLRFRK